MALLSLGNIPATQVALPQIDPVGAYQQAKSNDQTIQAQQMKLVADKMEELGSGAAYALDQGLDKPVNPDKWKEVTDYYEQMGVPKEQVDQLRQHPELAPILVKGSSSALAAAHDEQLFPLKVKELEASIQEHMAAAKAKGDAWTDLTSPEDRTAHGISPDDKGLYQVNTATGELKPLSGKGMTVNVGGNNDIGTIPEGWYVERDANGNVTGMKPIPNGPADIKQQTIDAADATKKGEKTTQADIVTTDIGRALDTVANDPEWTTGAGALLTGWQPGSDAKSVQGFIDTVKANASIDKLQKMREASPTGGALGSVTEREEAMLADTIGKLDPTMKREDFEYNLKRVFNIYRDIIDGLGNGTRYDLGAKGAPAGDAGKKGIPDKPPDGVTEDEWSVMSDEEKKLWAN
jgi:hypothetical protein